MFLTLCSLIIFKKCRITFIKQQFQRKEFVFTLQKRSRTRKSLFAGKRLGGDTERVCAGYAVNTAGSRPAQESADMADEYMKARAGDSYRRR